MPNDTHTPLPETMRGIRITEPGPPENLQLAEMSVPHPGPEQALIRVAASGVNRPDVLQRKGLYPPPAGASPLPGLEVSGTIIAVGDDVDTDRVNTNVCALLPGGGYADYALADARHCLPIPDSVSVIDAAGLPETLFTVWANVFESGALKPSETLLVHGGTSGIGMTAIAMGKAHGAHVITTAGTHEKCEKLQATGADGIYCYQDEDWHDAIKAKGGVDVVLDMAGGDFIARNLACLNPRGRHVSIAFLRGITGEINIFDVMRKQLTITGSTLRARDDEEKARLAQTIEAHVWPWFHEGKLAAHTDQTFPLEEAAKAHSLMEAGSHMGKILLVTEYGEDLVA